ncbi:MAG: hypothetical protein FJW88_08935 [Actinobacteria bacterium]|nr:hypothetical protein [Actinomycetota bacterium]
MSTDRWADRDVLPLANAERLAWPKVRTWPRYVIGLGAVAYVAMIVIGVGTGSFETLMAVPLIPALGYATYWIARSVALSEHDHSMIEFILAAFAAKMMGTLLRALVVSQLYNNQSDAYDFHLWGQYYAPYFRRLDFSQVPSFSGTDFMRALSGMVYAVTGSSKFSGGIVFSFLSFLGLLLCWRAFRRAIPDGDGYRYGLLVLFLPSLLYWPSSMGKEGFCLFGIGVASYGFARILTRRIFSGLALFALGVFLLSLLRPHIALTLFSGAALAAAVGKSRSPGAKTSLVRMVVFGALMVTWTMLASSTSSFFGVPSLNQESMNQILGEAEGRTDEAGSKFEPASMSHPATVPLAAVTVLFRPFPIEVHSPVAAASALEGVFLFGLCCVSWRRLRSIPRCMRESPYTAYCIGALVAFVYAFSAFSNFGILARQRSQFLPLFLVLVCLPVWTRTDALSTEEALSARDADPDDPYAEMVAPPVYQEIPPVDPYEHVGPGPEPYVVVDEDPYARFADPGAPDTRRGRG